MARLLETTSGDILKVAKMAKILNLEFPWLTSDQILEVQTQVMAVPGNGFVTREGLLVMVDLVRSRLLNMVA